MCAAQSLVSTATLGSPAHGNLGLIAIQMQENCYDMVAYNYNYSEAEIIKPTLTT
jgi:hypothetical protein